MARKLQITDRGIIDDYKYSLYTRIEEKLFYIKICLDFYIYYKGDIFYEETDKSLSFLGHRCIDKVSLMEKINNIIMRHKMTVQHEMD